MTEILLLNVFLSVAFVLAPLMTNLFFLNKDKVYFVTHKVTLVILLLGLALNVHLLSAIWLLFCAYGFFLYLKKEYRFIFSSRGLATCIPFVFALISATWFFAGANDWHLLEYDRTWSFYAALHGIFLGWIFVGCLAFLSRRPHASKLYLWGCYLSLVFFLCVAFGIDGIPYIKRVGVIGFSLCVPLLIGIYTFSLKKENRRSQYLAILSLFSIIVSMTLAVLNEFWIDAPRMIMGIPLMVLAHGFINAVVTVPCFFFAIWIEKMNLDNQLLATEKKDSRY